MRIESNRKYLDLRNGEDFVTHRERLAILSIAYLRAYESAILKLEVLAVDGTNAMDHYMGVTGSFALGDIHKLRLGIYPESGYDYSGAFSHKVNDRRKPHEQRRAPSDIDLVCGSIDGVDRGEWERRLWRIGGEIFGLHRVLVDFHWGLLPGSKLVADLGLLDSLT